MRVEELFEHNALATEIMIESIRLDDSELVFVPEAFEVAVPEWMRDFNATMNDLNLWAYGAAVAFTLIGVRYLYDTFNIIKRITRHAKLEKQSPEYRKISKFLNDLRRSDTNFDSPAERERYVQKLYKANRMINSFLTRIIENPDVPFSEKRKAITDVQTLQNKLKTDMARAK